MTGKEQPAEIICYIECFDSLAYGQRIFTLAIADDFTSKEAQAKIKELRKLCHLAINAS